MYAVLSENIKRRFLLELREFWSKDPVYKDSLVHNIQGKFSFDEKPQQAIILKSSSANPFQFSADHFQGTVVSYSHLARVYDKPGTSIEWIRDDIRAIQRNGGEFPSPAGVYFIEVVRESYVWEGQPGEYLMFYVDPLLDVVDERPLQLNPLEYQLSAGMFHEGSLQLYEMPGSLPLYEGVNYSADSGTGVITLTGPVNPRNYLSADYRYPGESTGPFPVEEVGQNNAAIPGVALAFGRRSVEGDVMAIVIGSRREENAREYGGKWEISLDFDVMARDVHAQGEITDRTVMYLLAQLRDRLSFEGIEITTVSHGGEAEEVYDETGDDYYFTASISVQVMTDWAIHIPLGSAIRRIIPNTVEQERIIAGLSDAQIGETGSPTTLHLVPDLGLVMIQDPWFRDRTRDFEMIR